MCLWIIPAPPVSIWALYDAPSATLQWIIDHGVVVAGTAVNIIKLAVELAAGLASIDGIRVCHWTRGGG